MTRKATVLNSHRSECPINLTLELLGDRWSLIVLRDIIFGGHRHFRELLKNSLEGIPSNMLSDRLKRLEEAGVISRETDPTHKQKVIYSLTEPGIELFPLLAQASYWGLKHLPVSKELGARARYLADGGEKLCREIMDQLREEHLGTMGSKKRRKLSFRDLLQAAFANDSG